MFSKFTINQKIAALKDHPKGDFKKDDTFTVLDIRVFCFMLVGVKIHNFSFSGSINCSGCDRNFKTEGLYYDQEYFGPVQEAEKGEMTFDEAVKMFSAKEVQEV